MKNRLTADAPTLFVDQYGERVYATTRAELCEKAGVKHCVKMYRDKRNGPTVWAGYVVGTRWFTAFKWQEVAP